MTRNNTQLNRVKSFGSLYRHKDGYYVFRYLDRTYDPLRRVQRTLHDEFNSRITDQARAVIAATKIIDHLQPLLDLKTNNAALERIIKSRTATYPKTFTLTDAWQDFYNYKVGTIKNITLQNYELTWRRFQDYIAVNHPEVIYLFSVDAQIMENFFIWLKSQGVAYNTYRTTRLIVSAIFARTLGNGSKKYFERIPKLPKRVDSHHPFPLKEILEIFDVMRDDNPYPMPFKHEMRGFLKTISMRA